MPPKTGDEPKGPKTSKPKKPRVPLESKDTSKMTAAQLEYHNLQLAKIETKRKEQELKKQMQSEKPKPQTKLGKSKTINRKARHAASKTNQNGVHACFSQPSLSQAELAGYLNVETTEALREITLHPDVKSIAEISKTESSNKYGKKTVGTAKIHDHQIFEIFGGLDKIEKLDLKIPLDNEKFDPEGSNRANWTFAVLTFRLFGVLKIRFPDSLSGPCDPPSSFKYCGIEAEDLNRVIKLLRYCTRAESDSRAVNPSARNLHKQPAVPTTFWTETDAQNLPDDIEEVSESTKIFQNYRLQELKARLKRQMAQEGMSPSQAEVENAMVSFEKSFSHKKASAGSAISFETMAVLDDLAQKQCIQNIGDAAIPYYEIKIDELLRIADENTKAKLKSDAVARSAVTHALQDAERGESQLFSNSDIKKGEQDDFQQRAKELNGVSARTRSYESALRTLGLQPNENGKLDKDGNVVEPWSAEYKGLDLLPHQIVGIAWCLDKLEGSLGGAILADDTGLGKTIQALETVEFLTVNEEQVNALILEDHIGDVLKENPDLTRENVLAMVLEDPAIPFRPYRPTLVLCPPAAIGVWVQELEKNFKDFKVHIYSGSPKGAKGALKGYVLPPSAESLAEMLDNLNTRDPATGRTVVVSTYQAWRSRILVKREETIVVPRSTETPLKSSMQGSQQGTPSEGYKGKGKERKEDIHDGKRKGHSSKNKDDGDEDGPSGDESDDVDDEEEEEQEYDEREIVKYVNKIDNYFGLVICDEGHKLKSKNTKAAKSVFNMKCPRHLFLTASIFISNVTDLLGILYLLWPNASKIARLTAADEFLIEDARQQLDDPEGDIPNDDGESLPEWMINLTTSSYRKIYKELCEGDFKFTEEELEQFYVALSPARLRTMLSVAHTGGPAGPDAFKSVNASIPTIMSIISLRRVMGDSMTIGDDLEIMIGADIPGYKVTTVELSMNEEQAANYSSMHFEVLQMAQVRTVKGEDGAEVPAVTVQEPLTGTVVDESDSTTRMSVLDRRRLIMCSLNTDFDKLIKSAHSIQAGDVQNWYTKYSESPTVFWHHTTRSDLHSPPYTTRREMAHYIGNASPKLEYLCQIILKVVIERKEKLIIYSDWPASIWLLEVFLNCLCLKFVTLRAGLSAAERDNAISRFLWESAVQILVASSRTAATSINLQSAASKIVLLDVIAPNTTQQIIGRCFRIKQTKFQIIWILTVNHTFDQVLQARAANTKVMEISAMSHIVISDAEVDAEMAKESTRGWALQSATPDEPARKIVTEHLVNQRRYKLYRDLYGLRSDRHDWGDAKNFRTKDDLPQELQYVSDIEKTIQDTLRERIQKVENQTEELNDHLQDLRVIRAEQDRKDAELAAKAEQAAAKKAAEGTKTENKDDSAQQGATQADTNAIGSGGDVVEGGQSPEQRDPSPEDLQDDQSRKERKRKRKTSRPSEDPSPKRARGESKGEGGSRSSSLSPVPTPSPPEENVEQTSKIASRKGGKGKAPAAEGGRGKRTSARNQGKNPTYNLASMSKKSYKQNGQGGV